MVKRERPLSPHLQIYRWQISNSLSILHRLTGASLSLGFLAFAAWLISLADGPRSFGTMMNLLRGPAGMLIGTGLTAAFCFHLLNGVRHLCWDAGLGFDKQRSRASGWFVIFGTAVLTAGLAVWMFK